jgi:hypothetical protein
MPCHIPGEGWGTNPTRTIGRNPPVDISAGGSFISVISCNLQAITGRQGS